MSKFLGVNSIRILLKFPKNRQKKPTLLQISKDQIIFHFENIVIVRKVLIKGMSEERSKDIWNVQEFRIGSEMVAFEA